MNSTKTWFAELLYAFKTLPRNPYVRHQVGKLKKIQIFIFGGYLLLTIAQMASNLSILWTPLEIKTFLLFDIALQMTYLQQISLFFLGVAIVFPLITVTRVIKENTQNRLPFVQLTPLSAHQIVVGILSRDFIYIIVVSILFLPLTILTLILQGVEFSYVIVTMCDLLLTALFFSTVAFVVGLFCHKGNWGRATLSISLIFMFAVTNVYWHEVFSSKLDLQEYQTYLKLRPFWVISRQGIQVAPIRAQNSYIAMNTALPYFDQNDQRPHRPNVNFILSYKSGDKYKEAMYLFSRTILKKLPFNTNLQQSIKALEKALVDLQLFLEVKDHDSQYPKKSRTTQNSNILSFQKLEKLLQDRKNYEHKWLTVIKRVNLESQISLREIYSQLWRWDLTTYEELYGEQNIFYEVKRLHDESLNLLFNELRAMETQNLMVFIIQIEERRKIISKLDRTNIELDSVVKFSHVVFRDVPVLLRLAEVAGWQNTLIKTDLNNYLVSITETWEAVLTQILESKLPISLLSTNFIGLISQAKNSPDLNNSQRNSHDKNYFRHLIRTFLNFLNADEEVWFILAMNSFFKLLIIVSGYFFIHKNILRQPPFYLDPSVNFILSSIFGFSFFVLSFFEDWDRYIPTSIFLDDPLNILSISFMLVLLMSLPYLLFYHTHPLFKSNFSGQIILLISLFLVVLTIWFSRNPECPKFQGIIEMFLISLLSFEVTKQVLSFKFSKKPVIGVTALGISLFFTLLISFIK